ncbi:MAG: matrixin family metalloprotease [Verrucomicrobiota bacterium]
MKLARLIFGLLVFCALGGRAFVSNLNESGQVQRWDLINIPEFVHTNIVNPDTRAVRYYIASDAYSTTNTAAEINAVRASFDQWQSIPGTHLKFEFAGLVAPGVDINTSDNTNVVFWVKGTTMVNNGQANILNALGVTFTSFFADNTLAEGDIVLNAAYDSGSGPYRWFTDSTDSNNTGHFVEGVTLHEIGHLVGLEHSPVGGATMLARGSTGIKSTQIGLSSDEIAAARFHYPSDTNVGGLIGTVTRDSTGIFGAIVVVEDANGNVIAGTVTRTGGGYFLPTLPPGTGYQVRAAPLDPSGASSFLVKGSDIGSAFAGAVTDFKPSAPQAASVVAGETNTVNIAVTGGAPEFWISRTRPATSNPNSFSSINSAITMNPGQSNMVVGVYGPQLPGSNATLQVTGTGITLGTVTFDSKFGLTNISVVINVASNAAPGLRSLVVVSNTEVAYANGFLEILPVVPDNNFDGFDDRFQRQYFALFTGADAKSDANPDGDAHDNLSEYIAGTNPTLASSILKIDSVTQNQSGATVTVASVVGKKYQLFARDQVVGSSWQTIGAPVTASGTTTPLSDPAGTGAMRFYRVQVLP